jgi:hypothetical protein
VEFRKKNNFFCGISYNGWVLGMGVQQVSNYPIIFPITSSI